jgi:hypothetical protein
MAKKTETIEAKIYDLLPDTKNANQGTPEGQAMLEASVKEGGAGRSVLVDKNGRLIGGNKTALAMAQAGIEEVVMVPSDGKKLVVVRRSDLDLSDPEDRRARRLALADNRTGEVSLNWDTQVLADLKENFPETLSGMFGEGELEEILRAAPETEEEEMYDNFQQGLRENADGPSISVRFKLEGQEEKETWLEALKNHSKEFWGKLLVDYVRAELAQNNSEGSQV